MSTSRLQPIENPVGPMLRALYFFSKIKTGKVISPLKVIYSRLPLAFGLWTNKMLSLEKKLPLSEALRLLIRIYIAQRNTCHFCIDIAQAEAMKKFKHQEKFLSVQDFESSDLFTAHEKAALRFAREVNDKKVTDANFHEIKKYFSEQEVISVAWMVMSENVYNIMNHAFAVESDGFCQIKK